MAFEKGISAITSFDVQEVGQSLRLTITPPADAHGLLPQTRQMFLKFRDVASAQVSVNGEQVAFSPDLPVAVSDKPVTVELRTLHPVQNPTEEELTSDLLTRVQGRNRWKSAKFREGRMPGFVQDALAELETLTK